MCCFERSRNEVVREASITQDQKASPALQDVLYPVYLCIVVRANNKGKTTSQLCSLSCIQCHSTDRAWQQKWKKEGPRA